MILNNTPKKIFTLEEVADILQLSVECVEQLVKNNLIFSFDYYHVTYRDLQDYILNENIESEVSL